MQIEFTRNDESLSIQTDHKVDVRFLFDSDGLDIAVYVDDAEYDPADDTLHGLFVAIGGQMISLYQLRLKANDYYRVCREEAEIEQRNWDRHVRSCCDQSRYI